MKIRAEAHWDGQPAIKAKAGKHEFFLDEVEAAGGTDKGPSPMQNLLASLGACLIAMGRLVASEMGLKIDAMNAAVEGELDNAGLMDKDPNVRPGMQQITVKLNVTSSEPADKLNQWFETTERRCPVRDVIVHGTTVKAERS